MPDWSVDHTQFEHSMFLTTIVIDGTGEELSDVNSQIAAFVGDEVRGVANLVYESVVDRYFAYLLVHSNGSGESVSFRAYDAINEHEFEILNTVTFEIDVVTGNLNTPLELLSSELSTEATLSAFEIDGVIDVSSISGNEVTVQLKEEVDISALTAHFSVSEGATVTVNQVVQVSGQTEQDFSETLEYVVKAANRQVTETYRVMLSIGPYPEISNLTNLTIAEGGSFDVFDLDEFEATYNEEDLIWSFSNAGDLSIALDTENQITIETPDEDWFGTDTLFVKVKHAEYRDLSDSLEILLTVNNVNDQPVFDTTPLEIVFMDSLYTYNFTVSDIDSDFLTLELLAAPDWLNVDFSEFSGLLFGVPDAIGTYTVLLSVSDGSAISQQSFSIVVSDRIIALEAASYQIEEGAAFDTIFLSSLIGDAEEGDFTYQLSGEDQLTYTLFGDTLLVSTPDSDYFGFETWDLMVRNTDDDLALGQTTLSFSVTNVNDQPVFDTTPLETVFMDSLYTYNFTVSDIDSEHFTLELLTAPDWLNIDFSEFSGLLFGVPDAIGTYTVLLSVSDGSAISQQSFSIVVSDRIIALEAASYHIEEGAAFDTIYLSSLIGDAEEGDFTYQLSGEDQLTYTLFGDTLLVSTPDSDYFGFETWDLMVRNTEDDLAIGQTTLSFSVTNVNDQPIFDTTPSEAVFMDSLYSYHFTVTDLDSDFLTLELLTAPDWLNVDFSEFSGLLFGAPDAIGTYTVLLSLSDGVATSQQRFSILVSDRIIEMEAASYQIEEGAAFDTVFLSSLILDDEEGDFTYHLSGEDQLTYTLSGDTLLVATPDSDYFGFETWDLMVRNTEDDLALGQTTLSFSVTNVNDLPAFTSSPIDSAEVNTPYQYEISATDVDGDDLMFSGSIPHWLDLIEIGNGAILSGETEDSGEYEVVILVTDGLTVTSQSFTISVKSTEVESSAAFQLAKIENQSIEEGRIFSPLNLDSYLVDRDPATVNWSYTQTGNLNVVLEGTKLMVRPPDTDWYGQGVLTIIATDTSDVTVKAEQVVIFQVNNVNDTPHFQSEPTLTVASGMLYQYEITVFDVDDDELDFTRSTFPDWLHLVRSANGAILFGTYEDDGTNTFPIEIIVSDGLITQNQAFEITVEEEPLSTVDDDQIKIYPNPVSEWLTIQASSITHRAMLIDFAGKTVRNWELERGQFNQISLLGIQRGTYLLRLQMENSVVVRKIILK